MHFQIQAQNFTLTDGLRHYAAWRLAHDLNHGKGIFSRVVVQLGDVNGPRGGVDKRCAIMVRIKGAADLFIEDVQSNLYVAIDRASERVGRTFDRRLVRLRQHTGPTHRAREDFVADSTP